jgi:hypothetical protein
MGKISNKVSGGLGATIAEAKAKINGDATPEKNTVEELLNSGAEAQKKRKRRTKAEMEAARQTENTEDNSLFEALETKEQTSQLGPMTYEQTCEYDLQKAVEKGLENPDFDFRNYYEKGQTVWFVRILEALGVKRIHKLYLRTIYPRLIVGSEDKAYCQCIGYNERDAIFLTSRDAQAYFDSIEITPKYESEQPKKRKRKYMDEGVEYTYDEEEEDNNEQED